MSTKRNYVWRWIILAGVLAGAVPGVLTASPVTYTYTGLPFTEAHSPYTTSDFVSGYFTVPTALADGSVFDLTPTSYSFSDGVQTISSANPPVVAAFDGITNSSGDIYGWDIFLGLANFFEISTDSEFGDSAISTNSAGVYGEGSVEGLFTSGSWVESGGGTSPVPEPGMTWLLAAALFLAFAGVHARQRQSPKAGVIQ
jgi:hypothetical protein